MLPLRLKIGFCAAVLAVSLNLSAQQVSEPAVDQQTVQNLLNRLSAAEARIAELENRLAHQPPESTNPNPAPAAAAAPALALPVPETAAAASPAPVPDAPADPHDHMESSAGPAMRIRGFLDLNAGFGSAANPMQFPLGAPDHATFQAGQFDLFISSRLERLQLTYRPSEYFEISGGRYHTSIGYYNTAFHHGTWFQTATGRPFMYFFEDNNGMLPVHSVGISTSGLVPGTRSWGLHWVAETTNGRASDPSRETVQNFLADKDGKGYNFAAYIAPEWAHGLQIGGSHYHDALRPPGIPHVQQNIQSAYVVYLTPSWEFLNDAVLLNNRIEGQNHIFRTPMMYTQISHKFGAYRPFFRYQYVNSPLNDPVNSYLGRMTGPSVGVRWDLADYAAFKLQYNRFSQTSLRAATGLTAQMAFTF